MKYKHVIVLYLIAWFILSVGSLWKIQSWPYASEILFVGTITIVVAHFLMILKIANHKDPNSFLNK